MWVVTRQAGRGGQAAYELGEASSARRSWLAPRGLGGHAFGGARGSLKVDGDHLPFGDVVQRDEPLVVESADPWRLGIAFNAATSHAVDDGATFGTQQTLG